VFFWFVEHSIVKAFLARRRGEGPNPVFENRASRALAPAEATKRSESSGATHRHFSR
jgi:hypothetical protein